MSLLDDIEQARGLADAAKNVKILTIDVERQRGEWKVRRWDPYPPKFLHMDTMVSRPRIMCFAAKWYGSDEIIYFDERGRNGKGTGGAKRMVKAMWELVNSADVIVTFNGDKADHPWMHEEFEHFGLPRPMPSRSIDLYKINKQRFARPYRSLRYLAREHGTAGKIDHDGKDLWDLCEQGDPDAWEEMREYNIRDVEVTEEIWLRQLSWLPGSAHLGVMIDDSETSRCPNCGSVRLTRQHKPARANVRAYEAFRCDDCGSPVRSNLLVGKPQFTRPIR